MKRLALALSVVIAVPLFAGDGQKAQDKSTEAQATAAPAESPLVQAARRTKRGTSKTVVITNATVKTSKGHITTTTNSQIVKLPEPAPSSEVIYNELRQKAKVEAGKQAAEQQERAKKKQNEMARTAAAAEEGEGRDDAGAQPVPPPVQPPNP